MEIGISFPPQTATKGGEKRNLKGKWGGMSKNYSFIVLDNQGKKRKKEGRKYPFALGCLLLEAEGRKRNLEGGRGKVLSFKVQVRGKGKRTICLSIRLQWGGRGVALIRERTPSRKHMDGLGRPHAKKEGEKEKKGELPVDQMHNARKTAGREKGGQFDLRNARKYDSRERGEEGGRALLHIYLREKKKGRAFRKERGMEGDSKQISRISVFSGKKKRKGKSVSSPRK